MNGTERARMSRVQELQEIERLAPSDLPELRRGYACGWCELWRDQLLIVPHPLSQTRTRQFACPGEAEIVGRVTGVAMRIAPMAADVSQA
jgi:hypothetical protein